MIKNQDINKWIEVIKLNVNSIEEGPLKDSEVATHDPVTYKKIKDEHDELLKLQEFLEKSKADYRFQPPNYLARLLHRTVTIYLFNGEKVEGIVDGFNNYEIRIKTGEKDILLQKHSIVRMEGDFSRQGKTKKEGDEIT